MKLHIISAIGEITEVAVPSAFENRWSLHISDPVVDLASKRKETMYHRRSLLLVGGRVEAFLPLSNAYVSPDSMTSNSLDTGKGNLTRLTTLALYGRETNVQFLH